MFLTTRPSSKRFEDVDFRDEHFLVFLDSKLPVVFERLAAHNITKFSTYTVTHNGTEHLTAVRLNPAQYTTIKSASTRELEQSFNGSFKQTYMTPSQALDDHHYWNS